MGQRQASTRRSCRLAPPPPSWGRGACQGHSLTPHWRGHRSRRGTSGTPCGCPYDSCGLPCDSCGCPYDSCGSPCAPCGLPCDSYDCDDEHRPPGPSGSESDQWQRPTGQYAPRHGAPGGVATERLQSPERDPPPNHRRADWRGSQQTGDPG